MNLLFRERKEFDSQKAQYSTLVKEVPALKKQQVELLDKISQSKDSLLAVEKSLKDKSQLYEKSEKTLKAYHDIVSDYNMKIEARNNVTNLP